MIRQLSIYFGRRLNFSHAYPSRNTHKTSTNGVSNAATSGVHPVAATTYVGAVMHTATNTLNTSNVMAQSMNRTPERDGRVASELLRQA